MKHSQKHLNICIGAMTIALLMALSVLACLRLNRPSWANSGVNIVYAEVQNIGELRRASPVKIAGVQVGCVNKVSLNPKNLRAKIEMKISREICEQLPINTELKVVSALPFGETFISLNVNVMALNSAKTSRMVNGGEFVRAIAHQSLENLVESFATAFKSNANDKK